MSDAALISQAQNPPQKVKRESLDHGTTPEHTIQQEPATTNAAGGGSHVTTSGAVVSSDDPSTRPNASVGEKLKGDVMGAVKGTVGSIQGAIGATIRNKDMEAKGLEKMQEEDQRLGAKHGVMPVGSDRRTDVTGSTAEESVPK